MRELSEKLNENQREREREREKVRNDRRWLASREIELVLEVHEAAREQGRI